MLGLIQKLLQGSFLFEHGITSLVRRQAEMPSWLPLGAFILATGTIGLIKELLPKPGKFLKQWLGLSVAMLCAVSYVACLAMFMQKQYALWYRAIK